MIYGADYYNGSSYVDISNHIENFSVRMSLEIEKLHVPTFNGESFKLRAASALSFAKDQHFRIWRIQGTSSRKYLFTGYIENIKRSLKTGDVTLEIMSEIEYLKTQTIAIDPPGNTHFERLYNSRPTGYLIGFADGTAANKANENAFISGIRVTYPYAGRSYADLLHDHMLIMNYVFSTNRFFFYILNKGIFIGSNQDDVILDGDLLIDIETDSTLTEIEFLYYFDIDEELRGDGLVAGSLPPSGTYYKRENTIKTAESLNLLNNISYDSVDYGIITGVQEKGTIKTYTATVIEFVAA